MAIAASAEELSIPGQRAALWAMATALVLTMTTWFSASAVIPQLREEWELGRTAASLLTIAVQLGFVVGAVGSSLFNVADIFPPKRVIALAAVGAAVANAGIVAVPGPEAAIALRFLTGAALAGVYPVMLKLIATWYRPANRGVALGLMVGALTLGSAMPHLVNGLGGLDWQQVILATTALTLAGAALVWLAVDEGPFPFPRAIFDPRQAGQAFSHPGLRLAALGYFGHMWELYAMWAWFVAFATVVFREHGVGDPGQLAALATFGVIGIGAVGCWAGGVLGDRWGRTRTTAAAMAISGACAVVIGVVAEFSLELALVLGFVWGLTVVADSAQFSSIVSELADQSYVGTALTLQLAVGFTLTVVTIWLVPELVDGMGWRWAFAFLAPGPAIGIVAMLALLRTPYASSIAGGRG